MEPVEYDKKYINEALDNDEYDEKNDEIDLIENILVLIITILTEEALLTMMTH